MHHAHMVTHVQIYAIHKHTQHALCIAIDNRLYALHSVSQCVYVRGCTGCVCVRASKAIHTHYIRHTQSTRFIASNQPVYLGGVHPGSTCAN